MNYKNSAFAPNPNANVLAKIQSLENFFKHESLSFSRHGRDDNDDDGMLEEPTKAYKILKPTNFLSLPSSPRDLTTEDGTEISRRCILTYT